MRLRFVLPALLAAALAPGAVHAASFPTPEVSYAADVVMHVETDEGPLDMQGRVWATPERERMEQTFAGHRTVVIRDRATGSMKILMPEQRMVQEVAPGNRRDRGGPSASWETSDDVTLEKVGSETVNGRATTKYAVTVREADGTTSRGHAWLTATGIPMKVEGTSTSGGSRVHFRRELRHVEVGPQEASRFTVPEGWSTFSMPAFPGAGAGRGGPAPSGGPDMEEMMRRMEQLRQQYGGDR